MVGDMVECKQPDADGYEQYCSLAKFKNDIASHIVTIVAVHEEASKSPCSDDFEQPSKKQKTRFGYYPCLEDFVK